VKDGDIISHTTAGRLIRRNIIHTRKKKNLTKENTENMRDNSYWLLLRKIVGHVGFEILNSRFMFIRV
jgi:hypothetical protein